MIEKRPNFAASAGLMGHPARSAMLLALRDGRALPMSLLASEAGVAPSTASEHLAKLTEGRLVQPLRRGRRRYFRLASAEVANAMDALAEINPVHEHAEPRATSLHHARTCYDHLAGTLGVGVALSLRGGEVLTEDARLTKRGLRLLTDFGVRVDPTRRQLVSFCVDWQAQRSHVGGALGAALLRRFRELDWLRPSAGTPRALVVTAVGRRGFEKGFGVDTDAWVLPHRPDDGSRQHGGKENDRS
jgi:DNA-binding transcriptional ArsR family regulator